MQPLKRVIIVNEISNLAKAWCRVKSSFAAAASDAPLVKRTGKRLPIGERRVMVQSFVNRYQGENSGKFPTVSHAMKQVGGSYYVVKKIMQELKYNFELRSSNPVKKVSSGTEVKSSYLSAGSKSDADEYKPSPEYLLPKEADEYKPSPEYLLPKEAEEIIEEEPNQCIQQSLPEVSSAKQSENVKEETNSESELDVKNTESKTEKNQPSHEYSVPKKLENSKEEKSNQVVHIDGSESIAKETRSESVLDVSYLENKHEEHQPSHEYSVPKIPENIKEEKPNQDVVNIDGSESIAEEHQKSAGELSEKKTLEKVQIKSSIWGTLRSVAEDFINIWKKR